MCNKAHPTRTAAQPASGELVVGGEGDGLRRGPHLQLHLPKDGHAQKYLVVILLHGINRDDGQLEPLPRAPLDRLGGDQKT